MLIDSEDLKNWIRKEKIQTGKSGVWRGLDKVAIHIGEMEAKMESLFSRDQVLGYGFELPGAL